MKKLAAADKQFLADLLLAFACTQSLDDILHYLVIGHLGLCAPGQTNQCDEDE